MKDDPGSVATALALAALAGAQKAAWGAVAGAVVGVAAAKSSPGNQVAVAAGTALESRLARPLSVV